MYGAFFRGSKQAILIRAGLLIGAVALVDWRIVDEIPLHFLYLLPMLMVGNVLAPWELAAIAASCTFLAEIFDDFAWTPRTGVSRDVLYFVAYFGAGLFVREVN